ncbi:hypothetical protein FRC96_11440 [Lujinxingia vulgaris]|uniref:Uncharacterized protein n=1 Tax=Lujinxingia vulgaris TaxID=2600176 RepID=A0A5C6X847_9DELT|nr:hypothetical protein [Lujinxingia vulgaris]TXD35282.1 hypothetical protein FRC96_11440 [Lujinxingia vulgaris]
MTRHTYALLASLALLVTGCTDPNTVAAECSPGQLQDCSEEPPDYRPLDADDIPRLCEEGCTHVAFFDLGGLSDVTELDSFNHLTRLGELFYRSQYNLKILDGFSSVERLGGVSLDDSSTLEAFRGFDRLERIDARVEIKSHPELRAITAFQNVREIGELVEPLDERLPTEQSFRLEISSANKLTDLSGFSSLEVVNFLALRHLGALTSMDDFGSLRETKTFVLQDLASLESIEGLASMEHIHQAARFLDLPNVKRCEIEAFIDGLETPPVDLMIERVSEDPCD